MSLLVKIPTRERGFDWMHCFYDLKTRDDTRFLISVDADNPQPIPDFMLRYDTLILSGQSKNKIDAYNRDINDYPNHWTVLLAASDDMEPQIQGYDQIILDDMAQRFPDTDGCLWYDTEDTAKMPHINARPGTREFLERSICMMPVIGHKYYARFGYVYHPSYEQFWCDNEQTRVAYRMGKLRYIHNRILKHQHPDWGGNRPVDDLYNRAAKKMHSDGITFRIRERNGFKN